MSNIRLSSRIQRTPTSAMIWSEGHKHPDARGYGDALRLGEAIYLLPDGGGLPDCELYPSLAPFKHLKGVVLVASTGCAVGSLSLNCLLVTLLVSTCHVACARSLFGLTVEILAPFGT